jgi:hypothetical protein
MSQGFNNLVKELSELITGIFGEVVSDELFQQRLNDINQRMSKNFGRIIGAILLNFDIVTIPISARKEGGSKPSVRFSFGGSTEDQKMGRELGVGNEMNLLLEEARRERSAEREEGKGTSLSNPGITSQPEEQRKTDLRNIGQIINSIRGVARRMNFNQRRFLAEVMRSKRSEMMNIFPDITEEQMRDDITWLQWVQNLFGEIQNLSRADNQDQIKEAFLALERLFLRAGTS